MDSKLPFEKTPDFAAFTDSMKRLIRVPKETLHERLKADRAEAEKSGRSKVKLPR
jgi:hypothetical protein